MKHPIVVGMTWCLFVTGMVVSSAAEEPAPQRGSQESARALPEIPMASPKRPAPPAYVAGELIVKFKESVTQCVHCLVRLKRPLTDATTDHADSLDRLLAKYHVRAARPLFRSEAAEQQRWGADVVVTLAQLRQVEAEAREAIARRFPQRAKRAPADAVVPETVHIYVLEMPDDVDVLQAASEFSADPHVAYAQPNRTAELLQQPPVSPTQP